MRPKWSESNAGDLQMLLLGRATAEKNVNCCNFSYFGEKIGENVEFKFCNPQKALPCAKPRHMSHRALKSVQSFFL